MSISQSSTSRDRHQAPPSNQPDLESPSPQTSSPTNSPPLKNPAPSRFPPLTPAELCDCIESDPCNLLDICEYFNISLPQLESYLQSEEFLSYRRLRQKLVSLSAELRAERHANDSVNALKLNLDSNKPEVSRRAAINLLNLAHIHPEPPKHPPKPNPNPQNQSPVPDNPNFSSPNPQSRENQSRDCQGAVGPTPTSNFSPPDPENYYIPPQIQRLQEIYHRYKAQEANFIATHPGEPIPSLAIRNPTVTERQT